MKLSRTRDKIHTPKCRYARLTWVWAEPRSKASIVAACRANGLTECGACKPFGGELRDDH